MVNVNGKEYCFEEDDSTIKHFVEIGHLVKTNHGYFWTEFHFNKMRKSLIRLQRSINNPLWKFYYSFFDW